MTRTSSFARNALSLYAIQGLQYLSPLLVLPILTRRLGSHEFGNLAYWQSLVGTLSLIIEYGFNYSAVRAISAAEQQPDTLGRIYRSTLLARLTLLLPASALLFGIPHWVVSMRDPVMPWLGLLMLLGVALSPAWYLTGLKRNSPLAYASAIAMGVIVLLTWLTVHGPQALHIAAAIQFLAPLLTALVALGMVRRYAPVPNGKIDRKEVWAALRVGAPLFFTSAAAGIYSTLNPFLLGLVASSAHVAYFSLGERLARAARGALSPLMAALFPYSVTHGAYAEKHPWVTRTSRLVLLTSAVISITLCACAPWLVPGLFGPMYSAGITVTQILSASIAIVTAGNLFGVQQLIAKGKDRPVLYVTIAAAPVHVVSFLWAGKTFGVNGAAAAYTLTEAAVTLAFYFIASAEKSKHET